MNDLLEKLAATLQSEVEVHTSMIAASKEMNAALRTGDVATVNKQRTLHDNKLCTVDKLEAIRIECCTKAAALLGIEKQPLRLALIIEKLPGDWVKRLDVLQRQLKEKLGELTGVTTSNRILLDEGLRMLGNTFGLLQRADAKYAGYGNLGKAAKAPVYRSIINKVG